MTERTSLDWGNLAPLRLTARTVAEGVFAGTHRSARRGAGIEFNGHRAYLPGDDLRWLDRRALMRHGRLLVREFETETDRSVRLLIDASASMRVRSDRAPCAKLAYAALIAAALARIALAGGDRVALDWLGGDGPTPIPGTSGREAFDRIVDALEGVRPGGNLVGGESVVDDALAPILRHGRRGSIVIVLSDLLDLPEDALSRIVALATRRRTIVAVQVLDPIEAEFPFSGAVRLVSPESGEVVETDAPSVREAYLEASDELARRWSDRLTARGGRLVRAVTTDDPVRVVREIVAAAAGRRG